jgi:hypothetical protein
MGNRIHMLPQSFISVLSITSSKGVKLASSGCFLSDYCSGQLGSLSAY